MKKNKKLKKLKKILLRDGLNWAIFIMFAITLTLKILELSSYEKLKIRIENCENHYSYIDISK